MPNNVLSDKNIADERQDEQVLHGIQPKHQLCYKVFKACRLFAIFAAAFAVIAGILTLVEATSVVTGTSFYRKYIFGGFIILALFFTAVAVLDRVLFLRRAPFDDWVFEIAQKMIGTEILFYDSKYIYLSYDRHGKEVDKKEFVTEMSDKSVHYSYFYVKTDIDAGFIVVECKKRAPIPERASFKPDDDKFWNIMPLGLTIHPTRQQVAPLGWYLNDTQENEELYKTIPSTSFLIAGGTGCFQKYTAIPMEDTIIK